MNLVGPGSGSGPVGFDHPGLAALARSVLEAGHCVVVPTDTVYGIAAAAGDPMAGARLQAVKARDDAFPPPVLVADPDTAWELVRSVPEPARRLARAFWPGPLTLIMACDRDWSLATTTGSLGVRVPGLAPLRALLRSTGPLAVSSANKHGYEAATTVDAAVAQFGSQVELYIDGGVTPGPTPSSVVDCSGPGWKVLRVGKVSFEEIAGVVDA